MGKQPAKVGEAAIGESHHRTLGPVSSLAIIA